MRTKKTCELTADEVRAICQGITLNEPDTVKRTQKLAYWQSVLNRKHKSETSHVYNGSIHRAKDPEWKTRNSLLGAVWSPRKTNQKTGEVK